jgi:preprotein translocase subunit SecD
MKILFQIVLLIISVNLFSQVKEKPVFTNREDGFYEVVDYNVQKNALKDLKLSPNIGISVKEISTIKKRKNEIDLYVINIVMTQAGAKKFKNLTKKNITRPIAIVLNRKLISAPLVMNEIPDGKVEISGNFTEEEIDEIINAVKNKSESSSIK